MKSLTLTKLAMAAAAVFVSGSALAAEPDYTLSYNAGVVTDYRYRGISQTRQKPALQGGVDFAHKNGFYAGVWGSSIKWIKDNSSAGSVPTKVDGSVELDLYLGYKGELVKDVAYDVGYLRYEYAGNNLQDTNNGQSYKNASTDELYGAVSYGPYTAKYSHTLGNLFGNYNFGTLKDSSGSGYLDLSATFDLGSGFAVVPHIGRQYVASVSNASYTDYSLTVTKDLGSVVNGLSASAMAVGTSTTKATEATYTTAAGAGNKFLGKSGLVLGVKYNF